MNSLHTIYSTPKHSWITGISGYWIGYDMSHRDSNSIKYTRGYV